MDYDAMSTPELQQECKRRGLPSGRVKAELVARLNEHDAVEPGMEDDFADTPAVEATPDVDLLTDVVVHDIVTVEPPLTPKSSGGPDPLPGLAPTGPAPTSYRCQFLARPDGPSEAEHLDYRRRTREAAESEGLSPRGDARRTGTVDGHEVYEISIRRVA